MSAPAPDEYHGQGGSYVLDPKTGRRTLIERTQEPGTAEAPATTTEAEPQPAAQE